ncbi:MAG: BON domain-containing protein [Gammaproteobacteria bacterium]|nr:BON domain-containing protein [Gammaproteobacteria bacterium]
MRRSALLLCTLLLGGCATGVFIGAGEPPVASEQQQADRRLAAAVTRALVEAPDVPAMDIVVEAAAGTVILRGQVPSRAAASRAVGVARGVSGVRAVQDALTVK